MSVRFCPPSTVLADALPASVGLDPGPIDRAVAAVRVGKVAADGAPYEGAPYAGVSALMGHHGRVVAVHASGWAHRWADADRAAPPDQRVRATRSTVYDLASCSKLVTALAVVQLVEDGLVGLEAPVARYLPEFAAGGKEAVTVRQCLTHTSGMRPELPLWREHDTVAGRRHAVMGDPPPEPPDTVYRYSDLNLIALGVLVERVTGRPLDEVVRERVTGPLGMHRTGYAPVGRGWAARAQVAATEWQERPPRGMVRGEVHDENAWSFGGVAGHAGVFSTVDDLAVLCQALLNGGTYDGRRVLSEDGVRLLVTDLNENFPGDAHGLGFELDQRWYMGALSGPSTAGHTGYTGTSVVLDLEEQSFAVLLTNRVHPVRTGPSTNPARRAWADGLALARPGPPPGRPSTWSTGPTGSGVATLSIPLRRPAPTGSRLSVDAWAGRDDVERTGLESTTDHRTWVPVAVDRRDRGPAPQGDVGASRTWWQVRAELPPGVVAVRWRTSAERSGEVSLSALRAVGRGVLLDGEVDRASVTADGWRGEGASGGAPYGTHTLL